MRVMAQMAMVMNLDKCIGCHTCSVTCKQAWTNRTGTEYVWFNNVETRPGQGYHRTYEDQDRWEGGWALDRRGRLDTLTVHVERRAGAAADEAERAGAMLVEQVKNTIGVSVAVRVIEPDGVERSMGKMRRIVDQRRES